MPRFHLHGTNPAAEAAQLPVDIIRELLRLSRERFWKLEAQTDALDLLLPSVFKQPTGAEDQRLAQPTRSAQLSVLLFVTKSRWFRLEFIFSPDQRLRDNWNLAFRDHGTFTSTPIACLYSVTEKR